MTGNPIYKTAHIQLATFVGGPMAIIYVIAENYKQLGSPEKIRKTWILGIAAFILFVGIALSIPREWHIPTLVIPLLSLSFGAAIMQATQGAAIKNHIEEGGQVFSLWRSLGIGVVSLLMTILLITLVAFIAVGLGFKIKA